mmetsp:Transcript_38997/g.124109  ORF Transcript_38997/g.124109 Transcript_38997/m.124109 type:complete len:260 (+) Transcript_38997:626-1405(+)
MRVHARRMHPPRLRPRPVGHSSHELRSCRTRPDVPLLLFLAHLVPELALALVVVVLLGLELVAELVDGPLGLLDELVARVALLREGGNVRGLGLLLGADRVHSRAVLHLAGLDAVDPLVDALDGLGELLAGVLVHRDLLHPLVVLLNEHTRLGEVLDLREKLLLLVEGHGGVRHHVLDAADLLIDLLHADERKLLLDGLGLGTEGVTGGVRGLQALADGVLLVLQGRSRRLSHAFGKRQCRGLRSTANYAQRIDLRGRP